MKTKHRLLFVGWLAFSAVILHVDRVYSMSLVQARIVYAKLVIANGIAHPPDLNYSRSSEDNAYQSGHEIVVMQGMLASIRNEHEAAVVLGHELGHYMLRHRNSTWKNEYAADKQGVYYAVKAGYNSCKGMQLIKRFHEAGSSTHPPSALRVIAVGCR